MPVEIDSAAATPTPYHTTLHYNEALVRRAVAAFWRRLIGVWFPFAMAVLVAMLVALLVQGDRSWKTGALAVFVALGVSLVVALYLIPLRDSLRKLREMGTPEVRFAAGESSFTVSSELGDSTMKWSGVTEVWRFRHFWLLSLSKSQFITLPLADIAPEMQAHILQRIKVAGGKVG
jgi:hypothetical protein